jgi:hypothetical protein
MPAAESYGLTGLEVAARPQCPSMIRANLLACAVPKPCAESGLLVYDRRSCSSVSSTCSVVRTFGWLVLLARSDAAKDA